MNLTFKRSHCAAKSKIWSNQKVKCPKNRLIHLLTKCSITTLRQKCCQTCHKRASKRVARVAVDPELVHWPPKLAQRLLKVWWAISVHLIEKSQFLQATSLINPSLLMRHLCPLACQLPATNQPLHPHRPTLRRCTWQRDATNAQRWSQRLMKNHY